MSLPLKRPNQASIRVACLGLSRTGVSHTGSSKWEQSIKQTLIPRMKKARNAKEPTESLRPAAAWWDQHVKQHPELRTEDFQSVLLKHNERVQDLIPASELLVYNVAEGWESLAEFFGVPIPKVPFPHVNDTQSYRMDRDLPPLQ
ncbi:hypothetical protein M422DRAFT_250213 [Sphaerobolus stellatus SS14]|uniref:Uncharacterized protein n=1 Tax=Sphaerobolus stellatus (strain SS14) TaxID=990650 RepID=A0A0C9W356_SPHS4|nr:hypothetical protein M422DRAFT_250213 [Sphaerobolus stellatus SS14]